MINILSKSGYNISCNCYNIDNADTVIVAMHGFAGDKESSCIYALKDEIIKNDIGLISFDWPGHGLSEVDGEKLRIKNCLLDIESVCEYLKSKNENICLNAFATSFGGYLCLLYNYYNPDTFSKIILRSPAINMYDVIQEDIMTEKNKKELKEKDYYMYGFERMLKVTSSFLDDLKIYNLNELYKNANIKSDILIIHGDQDDVVPITDSIDFCNKYNLNISIIEGADHRYKKDGQIEKVISIAKNFYADTEEKVNKNAI